MPDTVAQSQQGDAQSHVGTVEGCRRETGSPFRNWAGEYMTNPSVTKAEEERLTRLGKRVLMLFRQAFREKRAVTTTELVEVSSQYNSRVYEVRRYLIGLGYCIDKIPGGHGGVHQYKVVPIAQSTFVKKHRTQLEAEGLL